QQGRPGAVPREDPFGQLLEHLGRALGAQGRLRAGHHHDPGQPLLHPGGHRPMSSLVLAVELAWWQQTVLRTIGVLAAVLLPAGTLVYVFLFKMMSFMQSRLGPMEARSEERRVGKECRARWWQEATRRKSTRRC